MWIINIFKSYYNHYCSFSKSRISRTMKAKILNFLKNVKLLVDFKQSFRWMYLTFTATFQGFCKKDYKSGICKFLKNGFS